MEFIEVQANLSFSVFLHEHMVMEHSIQQSQMSVRDFLSINGHTVHFIKSDQTLRQAATMMLEFKVSLLPVVDESGDLLGVLMDDDVVEAVKDDSLDLTVGDLCHEDFAWIDASSSLREASKILYQHHVHDLLVTENNKIVGIFSNQGVLQFTACH